MWGVVKGFQIACNLSGQLGDLTGRGDQPSGKVVHKDLCLNQLGRILAFQQPIFYSQKVTFLGLKMKLSNFAPKTRLNVKK